MTKKTAIESSKKSAPKRTSKPISKAQPKASNRVSPLNKNATLANIQKYWDSWFMKGLSDFIKVPNLTPAVDKDYLTNGKVQLAMECVDQYI